MVTSVTTSVTHERRCEIMIILKILFIFVNLVMILTYDLKDKGNQYTALCWIIVEVTVLIGVLL